MFALVRTDPQAQPRHAGISFLLIDLHSPGIRVRPIKTIAGDDEFSEVFFDDVIVPAENLVGKLQRRLAHRQRAARATSGSAPRIRNSRLIALDRIKTMARASGIMADPAFRDRLAAASINVTALAACSATRWSSPIGSDSPRAGSVDPQDLRLRAAAVAQRSAGRGGRRPRARGAADRHDLRQGRGRRAVPAGAARDHLWRLDRKSSATSSPAAC